MELLKVLRGAWKYIIIDFIVKLPPSVEPITEVVFDSILVVTDRLTKYGYFILYKESSLVEELIYTFNKHIIENYEISKEIINDKNKLFILRFWKLLADQLGIYYKIFIKILFIDR
jgi:hypothetical protein